MAGGGGAHDALRAVGGAGAHDDQAIAGGQIPPRPRLSSTLGTGRWRVAAAVTVILGAWLAISLAELCYAAAWPPAQSPLRSLGTWLVAHDEHAVVAEHREVAIAKSFD